MANRSASSTLLRSIVSRPRFTAGVKVGARGVMGVAVLGGLWLGLGFAGYGLSLNQLSGWKSANLYQGEVRAGRITEARHSLLDRGYRFRIQGFGLEFFVPQSFIVPEGMPSGFQNGSNVGVKSTYQGVVLEMSLNAGTVFAKNVVIWGDGAGKYQKWVDDTIGRRGVFLFLGAVFCIAPLIAAFALRARFRTA